MTRAATLAAFLALSAPVHAGGYVAPVTEIIMPVDMPEAPAGGWLLVGGVVALGVLCVLLCDGDDETVAVNPDAPAPVPLPGGLLMLAGGLAGLGYFKRKGAK